MNKILSQDIILYLEKELDNPKLNGAFLFKEIKNRYRQMDVALICNYFLVNCEDISILSNTLKEIKNNKYRQNFEPVLYFIENVTNDDLKTLAIKTIAVYKDSKATPILLKCLRDKNSNYRVRFAAADALGKVGGQNAFEALKNVACDEDEKSAYVKESAVVALGNLGDNRAIDVFSSILSSKQILLEKFSYLKERIVESISKLDTSKNSQVLDILKKSISDTSIQVRINSIEALMNLEHKESYALIYERLKYDDVFEVKKNALIALYNISDRKILDEVINGDFQFELKTLAQEIIDEYEGENE